MRLNNVLV